MAKSDKLIKYLLAIFLFFIPWQTRWIWHEGYLNGLYWEYGSYSVYGTELILWAASIIFFIKLLIKDNFLQFIERIKRPGWFKAVFLAFFTYATAAVFFSKIPFLSYNYILHILEGVVLLVVLAYYKDKIFAKAFWLGAVFQGVFAIIQFLSQFVPSNKWFGLAEHKGSDLGASVIEFADERWLRAYGSFGWPNSLGIYLALALVIGFFIYLVIETKYRPLILVGNIAIAAGLFFSFSRGAWLAVAAGTILFLLKGGGKKIYESTLPVFFIFLILSIIYSPLLIARSNTGNRLEQKSIKDRQTQSVQMFNLFKNNLFFGVGPGMYTHAVYQASPQFPAWQYQPVHNIYLLGLTEFGLVGFGLIAGLVCLVTIKQMRGRELLSPLLATLFIAGFFDHFLWSMYPGVIIFWSLLAILPSLEPAQSQ